MDLVAKTNAIEEYNQMDLNWGQKNTFFVSENKNQLTELIDWCMACQENNSLSPTSSSILRSKKILEKKGTLGLYMKHVNLFLLLAHESHMRFSFSLLLP